MKYYNNIFNKVAKVTLMLAVALTSASCVDTVILPDDKIVDDDYWKNKEDVANVVTNAYKTLLGAENMRNLIAWGSFRSDELTYSPAVTATNKIRESLVELYSHQPTSENSFTSWAALYSCINYCNIVLEKAPAVMEIDPNYTEGYYMADCSQMLALRAMCYFYLIRTFRDVPMTTEAYMSDSQEMNIPQSAPGVILDQCINDLLEAEPTAISSTAYRDWRDKGYITKNAVWALLADMYLWRASVKHDISDYQNCVTYCDKIINAMDEAYFGRDKEESIYHLYEATRYYDETYGINGQNSRESIFELQFNSSNTNEGLCQMYYKWQNNSSTSGFVKAAPIYCTAGATNPYIPSAGTVKDYRYYENAYGVGGTDDSYHVRKFVAEGGNAKQEAATRTEGRTYANYNQNWIIYRLTDIMLMKAEALVQIGGQDDPTLTPATNDNLKKAFEIVQIINTRASGEEVMKYDVNKDKNALEMDQLVLEERARELCFEGKRWYDLLRYNYRHVKGDPQYYSTMAERGNGGPANDEDMKVLATRKYTSAAPMMARLLIEANLYMPINKNELAVNNNLVQNPAYQ
jgi:hypothetical protein